MNAFLTGSFVYGKHGIGSDIDLVVLVDSETYADLVRVGGMPCRFGDLNLILTTDEQKFLKWAEVTHRLCSVGRAITREEAVEAFNAAGVTSVDYGTEGKPACSSEPQQTDSSTQQTTSSTPTDVLVDLLA